MFKGRHGYLMLLVPLLMLLWAGYAAAHCQIPCGIYDDQMRVNMIDEDITTIEKSMQQITEIEKQSPINYNQLVRWVLNKETHADKIQEVVTEYFMTQRIKPDSKNYTEKLTLLHKMLIQSMLCKQTTDLDHVKELRSLLKQFGDLYFGPGQQ
ncbi:MAG: superoxide dismutase [Ni] [Desulfoferrobacter sp.]